ncbi:MAG TPA: TetR/AcrR family transcriptional regulator [Candidatus Acidoferrum sp.]|nr:TetR/AcrR family transcriptional regulator [Candidatus Acidoferrum sp.]
MRAVKRRRATQADRTAATCRKLISAAARIFARDGFEAARLEDIAAAAGYTRGALYANFKDKEDLFFALLEDWIGERVSELDELVRKEASAPEEKLRTLRGYYAQCAKDRRLVLLSLEFTLYAIRHPAAHARLRTRKRRLRAYATELIREITRSRGGSQSSAVGSSLPVSPHATTAALGALSNALLLEHVVDPTTMSDANVRHILGIFFDALFVVPSAKS